MCWPGSTGTPPITRRNFLPAWQHDQPTKDFRSRPLSVRKDRRRRGLTRELLLAGLHALARQGEHSARLYTGAANPYRSYELYESVGFRRVATFGRYRKPFTSQESDSRINHPYRSDRFR
ncbi:GNAT family N-acetyltransferase [Streptomyces sp. ME19-01-6]|uniref:GNAT family N-acetyltransferase n=1 Tax=Streptomyces sp. ME19-01-6 TaxID=3028686 RepID=UPI0039F4F0FE